MSIGSLNDVRSVVFYRAGQSLGGASGDDGVILRGLRDAGLDARLVDLADVRQAADGSLLLRDRATGATEAWRDPHSALMYHGAIAPPRSMELLRAMQERGTAVVNGPDAWPTFTDKHLFAQHMAPRGVNVIPTELVTSRGELRAQFTANGGEMILKKPVGTEGDDIFVVRDAATLEGIADRLPELGGRLIAQPLVDSRIGGDIEAGVAAQLRPEEYGRRHEFRINTARLASGDISVDASYMRIAPDADQVVNNVAQGARAIAVPFTELHPNDQRTMLDAARHAPATGDLVGWDLIGQPGQRQVIEGNSGSGLPNGSEGIDPRGLVATYADVLRDAGHGSGVYARER